MTRRLLGALLALTLAACSPAVVSPSAAPLESAPAAAVATATPLPPTVPPPTSTPTPALVPADLDGVLTSPELAHRLPLVVSIDDARVARPQSGFNATSMVWQAPADGYESRYLMFFQELDATDIGPVRSARNYLAMWAAELHGALAHYGGDRWTRKWMAANQGTLFTNVDGMTSGNPAYHRISTRAAPHNAYTTTADLWRVALRLGGEPTIDPAIHLRPFRDDAPVSERGTSQAITIPYHTVTIGYRYDPLTNGYLRIMSGKPHIDPMDGKQVTARTIVVLFMPFRTSNTIEPGHNRPVLSFVGTGKARYFMEGKVVDGTWSKKGETGLTMFFGPDGKELPLIRGRIFVQVVPIGTKITTG